MNLPLPNLVSKLFKRMCMLHCFNCTQLFATLGTVVHQAPMSMGFSPCPSPGDHPNPGIELEPTPHWQVSSLPLVLPRKSFMNRKC